MITLTNYNYDELQPLLEHARTNNEPILIQYINGHFVNYYYGSNNMGWSKFVYKTIQKVMLTTNIKVSLHDTAALIYNDIVLTRSSLFNHNYGISHITSDALLLATYGVTIDDIQTIIEIATEAFQKL